MSGVISEELQEKLRSTPGVLDIRDGKDHWSYGDDQLVLFGLDSMLWVFRDRDEFFLQPTFDADPEWAHYDKVSGEDVFLATVAAWTRGEIIPV